MARVDEQRELAEYARQVGRELYREGDQESARIWLSWAETIYSGREARVDESPANTAELERWHRGQQWADELGVRLVAAARAAGISWQRIGWATGLTDNGARKKWAGRIREFVATEGDS